MPNIDGGFAGKVAFVTGAASGIGRATALTFARERRRGGRRHLRGGHAMVVDGGQTV